MNKERDMTPMTKEEEYRNADVPMPEDEKDTDYIKHLKKFFKGKTDVK